MSISQKDYLKKYMDGPSDGKKKKKSKKEKKQVKSNGMRIVDEDAFMTVEPTRGPRMDIESDEEEEDLDEIVLREYQNKNGFKETFETVEIKAEHPESDQREDGNDKRGKESDRRKRNDSDDEEVPRSRKRHDSDASPPRRRRDSDASPPRRRRHDSGSPPRRKRHDSDEDVPRRRKRHDSDASPPRRRKDGNSRIRKDSESPKRRKRADSDEDVPRRRKRHDSDEEVVRRRKDSDASPPRKRKNSDASPPRRHVRVKEEPDSDEEVKRIRRKDSEGDRDVKRRRRNDSDSDQEVRRRKRADSDEDVPRKRVKEEPDSPTVKKSRENGGENKEKKKAGLLSRHEMKKHEEDSAKEHSIFDDAEQSGKYAEAVHRESNYGRRKKETKEDKERLEREAKVQEEINKKYKEVSKGVVQQQKREEKKKEMAEVLQEGFTRYRDDEAMNDYMKDQILDEDDPLADVMKKRRMKIKMKSELVYPTYKGHWPPNRFQIPPGYRWDGVNRSNGFEDKLARRANDDEAREKAMYRLQQELNE
ncbi:unnamed protein product [Bursaphelenchus xylophilus]|uniref:BUD13 homolog n=1 Tax=Bursaphelenchus xylophilus TaxID=6326 RepID=A0A1I7RZD7_BURXY|nr:unnamed protein product [Bursaphelenchus xylophilus]CAG9106552.1 unnamed protein product [Bursaphelenchus xylophilus]